MLYNRIMTVYVELVLIDNFLITTILGKLSYFFLGVSPKKARLVAAASLAAVASLAYPLVDGVMQIAFKLVLATVISTVLFFRRDFFRGAAAFLFFTAAFGGIVLAATFAFPLGKGELPFAAMPPAGISLLIGYATAAAVKKTVKKLRRTRDTSNFTYSAAIEAFGRRVECRALLDTGNSLYDGESGLPVAVIAFSVFSEILSDDRLYSYLCGNTRAFENGRYIPCRTACGKTEMFVFKPDAVTVYNADKAHRISDVMVGVSDGKIHGPDYGMILNPAIIFGECNGD